MSECKHNWSWDDQFHCPRCATCKDFQCLTCNVFYLEMKHLRTENAKLKEKLEIAVEALQFYAEGWHYRKTENEDVEIDTGEHATKALAEIKEKS